MQEVALMIFESENIEFKVQVTDDIYREVIAFANSDGGTIYIGIDNEGNAVGIDNVDETYTKITNGIRDAIMPDVTMFIKYTLQDNKVVRVAVSEGTYKPYYLKSKGLKPSGVYIRQGASSVPASPEQIRSMIKDSDGDVYEQLRSLDQELTFNSAKNTFNRYGVEFTKNKHRVLGMTDQSGELYTNLALLLSDQCQHTTKVAVFADTENTVFRDSREFGGSVLEQFEQTILYLNLCNKKAAKIVGIERIESADYPEEAIREALLNALSHRDYSFSGSIIINVNDDEMSFVSIGGLLPGLTAEDIRSGISQPRNKNLAEVFHRLRLVESYGTGIRRIFALYAKCPIQPKIEITPNAFKITLPNMNAAKAPDNAPAFISPQKQKVLDYIAEHGKITDSELRTLLGLKQTRAYTLVKEMQNEGLIKSVGRGTEKYYC